LTSIIQGLHQSESRIARALLLERRPHLATDGLRGPQRCRSRRADDQHPPRRPHARSPDLPLTNGRRLTDWVTPSAVQPRLNASLLAVFAAVALLIAAIGTYGVLAYSVSQRTKELGLRIALGADRRDVLGLVVREGMIVAGAGIFIGVGVAALMGKTLSALVFGVSIWDPTSYAGVLALLTLVLLLSCLLPALRASRVDPITALRLE
jgi:putative ABC transport system permease protein